MKEVIKAIWHDSWKSCLMSRLFIFIMMLAGLAGNASVRADDAIDRLPDPTRPSLANEAGDGSAIRQGLQLQSTMISTRRRIAVINGQRLTIGDRIQGASVTEIQPFQVTLQRAGRDIQLRLLPPLAKEKR